MVLPLPKTISKNESTIKYASIFFDDKVVGLNQNSLDSSKVIIHDDVFNNCQNIRVEIHYSNDEIWSFNVDKNSLLEQKESSKVVKKNQFIPQHLIKKNTNSNYIDTDSSKIEIFQELAKRAKSIKKTKKIKTGKNLVYYSLFDKGDDYVVLFARSCLSLNKSTSFDSILVITDQQTRAKIEKQTKDCNKTIIYQVIETPEDGIEASKAKTKIYDYEDIDKYENILFLDADTIAADSIDPIFELPLEYNILYTAHNKNLTYDYHYTSVYHGFKLIEDDVLEQIKNKDQMPFNAGQFLFKNSAKMKEHFNNVNWFMDVWPGEYFFEQVFMNRYFCSNLLTDARLFDPYIMLLPAGSMKHRSDKETILHFIGPALDGKAKNQHIDSYISHHRIT